MNRGYKGTLIVTACSLGLNFLAVMIQGRYLGAESRGIIAAINNLPTWRLSSVRLGSPTRRLTSPARTTEHRWNRLDSKLDPLPVVDSVYVHPLFIAADSPEVANSSYDPSGRSFPPHDSASILE